MNIVERIYLFFYLRRKQKALKEQRALPYPVISVGNLTVGGTGKTPFTIELAKILKKEGYCPVILTRGYRGRIKGPHIVTTSDSVDDVGDEAYMMAEEGLTVIKGVDRYKAGVHAIEHLNLGKNTVFILDDGFQHWFLKKDINILLVDGFKEFGSGYLVPLGSLRSPLSELSEADMIFITKKENKELYKKIKTVTDRNIYFAPLKILGIFNQHGQIVSPQRQRVFAFAGIGNFQSFIALIEENFKVVGYIKFIDHKRYSEKTLKRIQRLAKDSELIITTKKDFVKIKQFRTVPSNLYYLDVGITVVKEAVDEILSRLNLFWNRHR